MSRYLVIERHYRAVDVVVFTAVRNTKKSDRMVSTGCYEDSIKERFNNGLAQNILPLISSNCELLSMLMKAKWIRLHIHSFLDIEKVPTQPSPQQQLHSPNEKFPSSDPNHSCRIAGLES